MKLEDLRNKDWEKACAGADPGHSHQRDLAPLLSKLASPLGLTCLWPTGDQGELLEHSLLTR